MSFRVSKRQVAGNSVWLVAFCRFIAARVFVLLCRAATRPRRLASGGGAKNQTLLRLLGCLLASLQPFVMATRCQHVQVSVSRSRIRLCISRCNISRRCISWHCISGCVCIISRVCDGIATGAASYRRVAACRRTLRHCQRGSAREERGNNREAFQGDHADPPTLTRRATV
jgi:hypothetical protein